MDDLSVAFVVAARLNFEKPEAAALRHRGHALTTH